MISIARPRAYFERLTALLAAALLSVVLAGCGAGADADVGSAGHAAEDEASTQALFDNAVGSLLRLDTRVDMGLHTEKRIVSSRTTTNEQPALATTSESQSGSGKFDVVEVVSRNAQFMKNKVQAGDLVQFTFERPQFDPEKLRELEQKGEEIPQGAQQFRDEVVEVLDENRVRIKRGVGAKIDPPVTVDVIRKVRTKSEAIRDRLEQWEKTGEPRLMWHPSPDEEAIKQIVNRLNQWARNVNAQNPYTGEGGDAGGWKVDAIVDTLEPRVRELPQYKNLDAIAFEYYDGRLLQEAVWLRDIAANVTAVGQFPGIEDVRLREAYELFDWVIRHIQLDSRDDVTIRYNRPWQTLLYGSGTAEQRAWLFMLLAQQKGLDVVALSAHSADEKSAASDIALCGLLLDDDIFLFDARLGMPLPGPQGQGIATLRQATSDPTILESMKLHASDEAQDQPEKSRYFTREELAKVDAWIEGSPNYLARRMLMIESRLVGSRKVVLTSRPANVAERLKLHSEVAEVRLWPIAGETIIGEQALSRKERDSIVKRFELFAFRPVLWKARVLQFQGMANNVDPDESEATLAKPIKGAKAFYMEGRPTAAMIRASKDPERAKEIYSLQKMHSSYWLALILMDENNWREAEDWLHSRVLIAFPTGQFKHGASYNLARCYEADGRVEKAIAAYLADKDSPQADGNQLRAKWLRLLHPEKKESPPPTPLDDEPQADAPEKASAPAEQAEGKAADEGSSAAE